MNFHHHIELITGEKRSQGIGRHGSQRIADLAQSAQIIRPRSAN